MIIKNTIRAHHTHAPSSSRLFIRYISGLCILNWKPSKIATTTTKIIKKRKGPLLINCATDVTVLLFFIHLVDMQLSDHRWSTRYVWCMCSTGRNIWNLYHFFALIQRFLCCSTTTTKYVFWLTHHRTLYGTHCLEINYWDEKWIENREKTSNHI